MRATRPQLIRYLAGLAGRLWSMGAELDGEPQLVTSDDGAVSILLTAALPDSGIPQPADLRILERWVSVGAEYERSEYSYDLIDHPRGRRRAFHRHDVDRFLSAFDIAVHEHCEEQLGEPACDHYLAEPLHDGYDAIDRLMRAWTDEPLGCDSLQCLG